MIYTTPIVVNKYKQSFDVYIGRGSKFGNPFVIDKDNTREDVIEAYRQYLYMALEQGHFTTNDFLELSGKTLGCFCSPKACHGDVIVEVFNVIVEMLNEAK